MPLVWGFYQPLGLLAAHSVTQKVDQILYYLPDDRFHHQFHGQESRLCRQVHKIQEGSYMFLVLDHPVEHRLLVDLVAEVDI